MGPCLPSASTRRIIKLLASSRDWLLAPHLLSAKNGGTVSHYKSNLRDIHFNLFELLGRQDILGAGPFEEMDVDTAKEILAEVDRISREDLAASFEDGDRNPPVFDPKTNTAPVPASFKKSYDAWMEAGFWSLGIPAEIGGTVAPSSLVWATAELILGANTPVWMYGAGPFFGSVVYENGTDRDKKIAEFMVERQWGATMVLTEPDAGSDVGAGRAKATAQRRRLLEHHRRQALHHQRRVGAAGEHHAPGAGPPRGRRRRRRPRHQGPVALPGAEVPLRPRDR